MEWGGRQLSVQLGSYYLNMDFDSLRIDQN